MRVIKIAEDGLMPRTYYWQTFLDALDNIYTTSIEEIYIPSEDIATETNWPRYAFGKTAYLRGTGHDYSKNGQIILYINKLLAWCDENRSSSLLIINMNPFFRISNHTRNIKNLYIADCSLSEIERCLNNRTISFPALPIQSGKPAHSSRRYLASFQGVNSHPVRQQLRQYNNDSSIVIRLVDKNIHNHLKLDATKEGSVHSDYTELLMNSIFAFIPRGDALFSYRLLEAMSFGCIPVILSDGWVLPFDRTINWESFCIKASENNIGDCIKLIASLSEAEIHERQTLMMEVYESKLKDISSIIKAGLYEIARIRSPS